MRMKKIHIAPAVQLQRSFGEMTVISFVANVHALWNIRPTWSVFGSRRDSSRAGLAFARAVPAGGVGEWGWVVGAG